MRLVKPSFEIMEIMGIAVFGDDRQWKEKYTALELIEKAGRVCYKSEDKITTNSAIKFVQHLNDLGHESVIEHSAMTVKFIIDRGVSHELVRHRLCAFSQESTRYCNYKGGVTFVIPPWFNDLIEGEFPEDCYAYMNSLDTVTKVWFCSMIDGERWYKVLLHTGLSPQQARSVLPNSLKTEIVVTANFREWRHIFKLRCSKAAHPQMREIMIPLHEECKEIIPVVFDNIIY